ncbi:MAG: hypothetical protein ACJAZS_000825 [Alteromonas naphthalenivorans]|jgi:hypothetical protein
MIYFNATFFIQIIHFLFAWWVLRRFLFRPVVSTIQHEKGAEKRLSNSIVAEQSLLKKAQIEQHRQWSWYQQQFKKRIPVPVEHVVISDRSFKKLEVPDISQKVEKRESSLLTDSVVVRFAND